MMVVASAGKGLAGTCLNFSAFLFVPTSNGRRMPVLGLPHVGRRKPKERQPRLKRRLNTASCQCQPSWLSHRGPGKAGMRMLVSCGQLDCIGMGGADVCELCIWTRPARLGKVARRAEA
jgi:hypothetical protein